ncbi:MAG: hypothetical protein M1305_05965 [Candidatus Marsarchaeota archaeon]|nr:hypothetical protein [Candidatus Marsarchaeota archaeon]
MIRAKATETKPIEEMTEAEKDAIRATPEYRAIYRLAQMLLRHKEERLAKAAALQDS